MQPDQPLPDTICGLPRYLSAAEVLALTGWSRWTLQRKVAQKRFPPSDPDVGGYRRDWIAEWQDGKRDWTKEAERLKRGRVGPRPTRLHKGAAAGGRPR